MRRLTTLTLLTLAAVSAIPSIAEAQTRRQRPGEPLSLTVRPRSFLDPGTVVSVGSLNKATSAFAQTQSYLVSPPYANQGTRFGRMSSPTRSSVPSSAHATRSPGSGAP